MIPNAIAFSVFGMPVRWYAIFILLGIAVGWLVVSHLQKKYALKIKDFSDLILLSAIFSILGARIYYVFYAWDFYKNDFWSIFKINQGGLGIFGALFGVFGATIFWAWRKKLNFWELADQLSIMAIIGQIFGRWGNYFNQEVFGRPVSWGIYIESANRPIGYENFNYFLPTFLFEIIGNILILFVLLKIFALVYGKNKKMTSGSVFLLYILLYSILRFCLEFWRIDYSGYFLGLRAAAWICLFLIFTVGWRLIFLFKRK